MQPFYPVIMCGGSGTRLWPLSRSSFPKQFIALSSQKPMLIETIDRALGIEGSNSPIFLCHERHRFMAAAQAQEAGVAHPTVILEPAARNTAPAIALAAFHLREIDEKGVMLVLAADHVITQAQAFRQAVEKAALTAAKGWVTTFGVRPTAPNTGYGYIKSSGEALETGAQRIEGFTEKPDLETAEAYLADGRYLWNSGMFAVRVDRYLSELAEKAPEVAQACERAMADARKDIDFIRPQSDAFLKSPSISIDYAIMEKDPTAAVVPCDIGWSDIGSWRELREVSHKDSDGNAILGDVVLKDVANSYVRSEDRLTAVIGMEDVTVVSTADAVLVAPNNRAQEVKQIVAQLQKEERTEWDIHTRVYRPWGFYEGVHVGARHQVKHIQVNPGAKLSLQKHFHRAEHWVVVQGAAIVTRNDEEILLSENQSIYLPLGCVHRLENPGKIPLSIVEVQTGSYLGEDDIVRFEDVYNRVE